MGFYIETDAAKGKAEFIVKHYGARMINLEEASRVAKDPLRGLVCCVYNLHWDAVGFVYNEVEFNRFANCEGDWRPRRWFEMDRDLVIRLTKFEDPIWTRIYQKSQRFSRSIALGCWVGVDRRVFVCE